MARYVYGGTDAALLHPAVLDVRHPGPGGQHRLRRLPPGVVDHRQRRLPAPTARQPRRPPGLLQRHRRARRWSPAGLIVAFGGDTSALIPLYAVGVFTGFTLSQAGMVIHHRKVREKGWRRNQVINAVGVGAPPFIVLLVVVVSKFTDRRLDPGGADPDDRGVLPGDPPALRPGRPRRSRCRRGYRSRRHRHTVIVLVGNVHRGVLDAHHLRPLARARPPHRAVGRPRRRAAGGASASEWEKFDIPVELRTVYSPYRELSRPGHRLHRRPRQGVARRHRHRRRPRVRARATGGSSCCTTRARSVLRARLRLRPNTVVIAVPIHVYQPEEERY